jgi:hypothetical protein
LFFILHLLLHNAVNVLMIQFVSVIVCEDASEGEGLVESEVDGWRSIKFFSPSKTKDRKKERTPALDSQTFTTKQK